MPIPYTLIRSRRKTISIQISPAGEVTVRCPSRMSKREVQVFVDSKAEWIRRRLSSLAQKPQLPLLTLEEISTLTRQAKAVLSERTASYAQFMGVDYGRITVRCQHTRWGSCSAKGNLNFNCLLMLTPPEVQDYVIVHELCHRKELNHSRAFWAEVEKILPDYRVSKKWLKENGSALIGRLPPKE